MCPNKLVIKGPGATLLTQVNQINIILSNLKYLDSNVNCRSCTKSNTVFILICWKLCRPKLRQCDDLLFKKSTGINVKGYSLVLIVYNNDKSLSKKVTHLSFWLLWAKRRIFCLYCVCLQWALDYPGSKSTGSSSYRKTFFSKRGNTHSWYLPEKEASRKNMQS